MMSSDTLKCNFDRAFEKVITSSLQVSYVIMLSIYALYKQATKGDAPISGPWAFHILVYDKWNTLRGKTKESAMSDYITEVTTIYTYTSHTILPSITMLIVISFLSSLLQILKN